jgi:ATPase subunit of ABC transporter with duplicated ATPase domains
LIEEKVFLERELFLVRPKNRGTRRKVASKRRKNLERELDWVPREKKDVKRNKKARLQNYDKLLNEDQNNDENLEIYIPNGPRLGTMLLKLKCC